MERINWNAKIYNEQVSTNLQLPLLAQARTWAYMSNQQFAPKVMESTPGPTEGSYQNI